MTVQVRRVGADVVRPLRQAVLRPGSDPAESVYPQDDDAATVHIAALDGEVVVGTATMFPEEYDGRPAWRLRGMAVAEERRGSGIGSVLFAALLTTVQRQGCDLLWCNARTVALTFYRGHGFDVVGDEFLVASGVPHYVAVLTDVATRACSTDSRMDV